MFAPLPTDAAFKSDRRVLPPIAHSPPDSGTEGHDSASDDVSPGDDVTLAAAARQAATAMSSDVTAASSDVTAVSDLGAMSEVAVRGESASSSDVTPGDDVMLDGDLAPGSDCPPASSDVTDARQSVIGRELIERILCGSLVDIPPLPSNIVRIFLSSTFAGMFRLEFYRLVSSIGW